MRIDLQPEVFSAIEATLSSCELVIAQSIGMIPPEQWSSRRSCIDVLDPDLVLVLARGHFSLSKSEHGSC